MATASVHVMKINLVKHMSSYPTASSYFLLKKKQLIPVSF